MDWVQLVLTGGVSLAIIVYIAALFERRIWPSIQEQRKTDKEAREAERKERQEERLEERKERREDRKEWDQKEREFLMTLQQINAHQEASTRALELMSAGQSTGNRAIEQLAQAVQQIQVEMKQEREARSKEHGGR